MKTTWINCLLALFVHLPLCARAAGLMADQLSWEYRCNPLGIRPGVPGDQNTLKAADQLRLDVVWRQSPALDQSAVTAWRIFLNHGSIELLI